MTVMLPNNTKLPILAKMLQIYLRSELRGSTRLTLFLAQRLKSLQAVPIAMVGCDLYVDLRSGDAQTLLINSPYEDAAPCEVDEQQVMRRIVSEGDIAFDIGANIGMYTVLLSRLVGAAGKVCAFEANAELSPVLERTVRALKNVTLHLCALSDQFRETVLLVPQDSQLTSSLADWTEGRYGQIHEVACTQHRLDDLIDDGLVSSPDFIKCDVEGAELLVFRGGCKALDCTDAPIILYETNVHTVRGFGLKVSDATDFLAQLKRPAYHFFKVESGGRLLRVEKVASDYGNMLAIPESKVHRWPELSTVNANKT